MRAPPQPAEGPGGLATPDLRAHPDPFKLRPALAGDGRPFPASAPRLLCPACTLGASRWLSARLCLNRVRATDRVRGWCCNGFGTSLITTGTSLLQF